MSDTPDLYVPRARSAPWQVLQHLIVHPEEELTRAAVTAITGLKDSAIEATLSRAVNHGALQRRRNNAMHLVWRLGMVKTFRLDEDVAPPPEAFQPIVPPPASPAAKWSPTAAAATFPVARDDVQVPRRAAASSPPVQAPPPMSTPVADAPVPAEPPSAEVPPADVAPISATSPRPMNQLHASDAITMPRRLTPAQLQAIARDPRTRFEDRTDHHHAVGWLLDAYEVLVEVATGASTSNPNAGA